MPRLVIIAGPTASGKTDHAINLALKLHTEIISCDSRQFYNEMRIGVARPTEDQLAAAPHHFIACRSALQPYNIYDYEQQALSLLQQLFLKHDTVIAVGGSGLYINALRNGVALLPDPSPQLREKLQKQTLEQLQSQLQQLDPDYWNRVDQHNPIRLQRALEICLTTGQPYSQIIANQQHTKRPFDIDVQVLQPPLDILRQRINKRVDQMMDMGLDEEVEHLWHLQHLNTLRTVGYREFFAFPTPDIARQHLDEIAIQIKQNTYLYARKQLTWCRKHYL